MSEQEETKEPDLVISISRGNQWADRDELAKDILEMVHEHHCAGAFITGKEDLDFIRSGSWKDEVVEIRIED